MNTWLSGPWLLDPWLLDPWLLDPWFLGLLGFAVAASVTPGPNNIMVTANAARNGIRGVVPHMLGIAVGFSVMIFLVGAGLAGTLLANPMIATILRYVALAWLLKLAWNIADLRNGAVAPHPAAVPYEATAPRCFGFLDAVLFQWINPKAWLIALSIAATWVRPDAATLPQILLIALVFLLVGPPSNLPWALLGTGAAGFLKTRTHLRVFNVAMAVLLVMSMLPALFA